MTDPSTEMRSRYLVAGALWCLTALALKPFYPYVDFAAFYSTAIDKILAGSPLEIYSFVARPPDTGLAIPLSYPPFYFFYLAPLYALGKSIGLADFHLQSGMSFGQSWMLLATLPFDLLLCRQVLRLAERVRGPMTEPYRLYFFVLVLLSPLLWLSSVRFHHSEAMMLALILLAIEQGENGRAGRAGLLWAVALSIKATAAVPALVYFGWGLGRERRKTSLITAAIAVGVVALEFLPYLVWRWEQVWYAIVGFEGVRPVGGYVLWKLAAFPDALPGLSNPAILIGAAVIGLVLARRPGSSFLAAGGAYGLVLSQAILLLLAKAVFVWYGLALGMFCYIAFQSGERRRSALPAAALSVTFLLWLIQSGPWSAAAVNTGVLIRSASWVALLSAIAVVAIHGMASWRRTRPVAIGERIADPV